ncbi:alkanesulfonate monooxygenase SsuD/methylene tetrahydromethanopterin reductase-like flavin-dependent oxidoreductase (luciferase family) [Bradyrhizobium sp. USDA 326]
MMPPRLRVFPAISRNRDPKAYIGELMRVARFADRYGFEGILLFEGNDVFVEPWAMAQHIMTETTRSSPLIAVNPVYMHPFTTAKFVSSFAALRPEGLSQHDHGNGDQRLAGTWRRPIACRSLRSAR